METSAYEKDFCAWADTNVRLLRLGRFSEIDVEHIAEELEGMTRSERRELGSRLAVLMAHLLKWRFQPERRSESWRSAIDVQRGDIADLLEESPSLRHGIDERIGRAYAKAIRLASGETGLSRSTFPEECPFTIDQLLDEAFWP